MHASADVLKTIASSDIGRRILADAAKERLANRRALVAERNRIKAEGDRRGAAAASAHAAAKAARDEAETAFKAAQLRELEAVRTWSSMSSSTERGIFRCNRELEITADPRIDELISWLQGAHNRACSQPSPPMPPTPSEAMVILGKAEPPPPPRKGPSDPEIIRAAIAEARGLKYEALDEAELEQRLAEIMASVPSEYARGRNG